MAIRAQILGAAAGGGLPQWNCGCENCNLARKGLIPSQTQSSLSVASASGPWALLNASPDVRAQLAQSVPLHPTGLRELPLASVMVTNGDIDHVAGLLTLREVQPFTLFATREILAVLSQNPIFDALRENVVTRQPISLSQPFELARDLTATAFAVPGKVPLYMEGETVQTDLLGEQTVGVELKSGKSRVYYIPGCAALTSDLRQRLTGAQAVFFDGTLWRDDEMILAGLGAKTGQRM
ncbi:MAG: MBL fold metallo-hydrolase, partial [Pseudomonadota bacterium]